MYVFLPLIDNMDSMVGNFEQSCLRDNDFFAFLVHRTNLEFKRIKIQVYNVLCMPYLSPESERHFPCDAQLRSMRASSRRMCLSRVSRVPLRWKKNGKENKTFVYLVKDHFLAVHYCRFLRLDRSHKYVLTEICLAALFEG